MTRSAASQSTLASSVTHLESGQSEANAFADAVSSVVVECATTVNPSSIAASA